MSLKSGLRDIGQKNGCLENIEIRIRRSPSPRKANKEMIFNFGWERFSIAAYPASHLSSSLISTDPDWQSYLADQGFCKVVRVCACENNMAERVFASYPIRGKGIYTRMVHISGVKLYKNKNYVSNKAEFCQKTLNFKLHAQYTLYISTKDYFEILK